MAAQSSRHPSKQYEKIQKQSNLHSKQNRLYSNEDEYVYHLKTYYNGN